VDRVVGLVGVRAEIAMVETPDGHVRLELVKFHAPSVPGRRRARAGEDPNPPSHIRSRRHRRRRRHRASRGGELVGEVENYKDIYRLCYVRGPERIIVELAERIG
jgi:hypothetical protein